MHFWLATFILNLMIPLILLLIGNFYLKKPITKLNWTRGYRTERSMQNQETWEFAQKHFGNNCYRTGFIFTLLTIVLMLSVFGQHPQTIGILGNTLGTVEGFTLVYVLATTEYALKKKYDK